MWYSEKLGKNSIALKLTVVQTSLFIQLRPLDYSGLSRRIQEVQEGASRKSPSWRLHSRRSGGAPLSRASSRLASDTGLPVADAAGLLLAALTAEGGAL